MPLPRTPRASCLGALRPALALLLAATLPPAEEASAQRGVRGGGRGGGARGGSGAPAAASPASGGADAVTQLVGRPTDRSAVVSVLAAAAGDAYVEYGTEAGRLGGRTAVGRLDGRLPAEFAIAGLRPDTRYHYRVLLRSAAGDWVAQPPAEFRTQRAPGSTFAFTVQGDSHPERAGRMYDATLYRQTLGQVAAAAPDFHVLLGDDFSIERLIAQRALSAPAVEAVYRGQRDFLAAVGRSTPLVLVNGNHEEAARVLLDGTATSAPVLAARARIAMFPLPEPDGFYTGDTAAVPHVGRPRDYYAWTWGDALFVVLDPYWHSQVVVDAPPGGGGGNRSGAARGGGQGGRQGGGGGGNALQATGVMRDLWNVTLGDAQYAWLTRTLEGSRARYKFVFAHHVLGTGRGGVELADLYEWGGRDRRGDDQFRQRRPSWPLPIHQLMVRTGVTAFFQGHDHLFAHQEKDGVIYQSTPNPADPTYTAFNREAYRSGTVLPNSGHLRVTVSPDSVQVAYIRSFLPADTSATQRNGAVAHAYTVRPRGR